MKLYVTIGLSQQFIDNCRTVVVVVFFSSYSAVYLIYFAVIVYCIFHYMKQHMQR